MCQIFSSASVCEKSYPKELDPKPSSEGVRGAPQLKKV